MKIQLLSYKGNNSFGNYVEANTFNKASVFDMFDVTIIDLSDPEIWKNKGKNTKSVNCINDLKTIGELVQRASKCKIIIMLPDNLKFHYYDTNSLIHEPPRYMYDIEIKDMLADFYNILITVYPLIANIVFGFSKTQINNSTIEGSFFFEQCENYRVATKSIAGNTTTIQENNIYITTLKLKNKSHFEQFFKAIGVVNNKENVPDWFKDVLAFDDEFQMKLIQDCENVIEEKKKAIDVAYNQLETNAKWKSILYSQKEELVDVVLEMLDLLFGTNTKEFVDEKKEDFRFTIDETLIMGEIKGVTSNVSKANISQVMNHCYQYEVDHPEDTSNKKPVLIINNERNRAPEERDDVHDDVNNLAYRNEVLVITTPVLLNMFEKYLTGSIDRNYCSNIFCNKSGVLKL